MKILYCQYCGELLDDGCTCAQEADEYAASLIEELEERQHQSGFYAFQDMMDAYRFER